MLSAADVPIEPFLAKFAQLNVPVAFLVPTETGYKKSIMDATAPVRELLENEKVHVYEEQLQGPANKKKVDSYFVYPDRLEKTEASLYRPMTKKGDPRIWFAGLKQYCNPYNLLALVVIDGGIYVINLSNPAIAQSLIQNGYVYNLLSVEEDEESIVERELLGKIQAIHDKGFLPSITKGDPGVGDTLEHALGISRNNDKNPDYKGIELKATRHTRNGKIKKATRINLFSQVPDGGLTYREILDDYGKMQIPRGDDRPRFQLCDTLRVSHVNGYGLVLDVDDVSDRLYILHYNPETEKQTRVSWWDMSGLRKRLLQKHPRTFWVTAESEMISGVEHFLYTKILYTKNPNAALLTPLLASGVITIDLAAHITEEGKHKNHGALFKIDKKNLSLLFANPEEFIL
ncbi:MvaI/BcnI family restriction endonuclease [Bifidobacterium animalis]|uniref:MvaI/BcnI family restriction endonuclease n=1 Tax=Bifidobacterium animalis TaxID=28025 RepID=UPI00101FDCEB|nr:MvaI/BcnI family restriction endonuclease [Bifidobacterium animalis]RYN08170.1 MvaI/BcnI restriction endonuclease family [Bifidobacterium animalis subsp. lactis]